MEKQELLLLEKTLGNLYYWKEEIVMAPPGQAANGLMIYIHSTVEMEIDNSIKTKPHTHLLSKIAWKIKMYLYNEFLMKF